MEGKPSITFGTVSGDVTKPTNKIDSANKIGALVSGDVIKFTDNITPDVPKNKLTPQEVQSNLEGLNKELNEKLSEARKDYIQIFGVFASIITLVGFNANSAQKGIWEIIIGNFTLGIVFVGFIYLLYVVPVRVSNNEPFIKFPQLKNLYSQLLLLVLIIFSAFGVVWAFVDEKTNFGFCSLYPFAKLEINSKIYCIK